MKRGLIAAAAVAALLFATGIALAACGAYQEAYPGGAESSVALQTATIVATTMPTTTESMSEPTAAITEPTATIPEPAPRDGRHFGYIKSVDLGAKPSTLTFDLAIHLGGEEANREAKRRGYETPVPNDYFIVNDDPKLWTLPLSEDLELRLLDWNHCCGTFFAGELDLFAASFQREQPLVGANYRGAGSAYDLTVRDGVVLAVEERYFP